MIVPSDMMAKLLTTPVPTPATPVSPAGTLHCP
jgi:hypothetical protein